ALAERLGRCVAGWRGHVDFERAADPVPRRVLEDRQRRQPMLAGGPWRGGPEQPARVRCLERAPPPAGGPAPCLDADRAAGEAGGGGRLGWGGGGKTTTSASGVPAAGGVMRQPSMLSACAAAGPTLNVRR